MVWRKRKEGEEIEAGVSADGMSCSVCLHMTGSYNADMHSSALHCSRKGVSKERFQLVLDLSFST